MKENEIIGDKLNAFLHETMQVAQSLNPKPSEYLVFNNPNGDNYQWFILIFFSDSSQQNKAIKDGICYLIHKFVWDNMNQSSDFKDLNKTIFFDSGIIPKEEKEINKIFTNAIIRLESLTKEQGQANPEICSICDHGFGGHHMMSLSDEASGVPSEGWITCSEERCNCFRTWSRQVIETHTE